LFAINAWTPSAAKPDAIFPGSFPRLLFWIWKVRVRFPDKRIYLRDDNITNVFRFIFINQALLACAATSLAAFLGLLPARCLVTAPLRQTSKLLLLYVNNTHNVSGYTTSSVSSPATHVHIIQLLPNEAHIRPLAPATIDALNSGALTPNEDRKPTTSLLMQVDDYLYADTAAYFPRTIVTSICLPQRDLRGALSIPGASAFTQEAQPHPPRTTHTPGSPTPYPLNDGQTLPAARGIILPQHADDKWFLPNKHATIKDIATTTGIIGSAMEYFTWARAQLLLLYSSLLRNCVNAAYSNALIQTRIRR